jgi:phosphoribosylformylglycinamidine synthase
MQRTEQVVNVETAENLGLSASEFERIQEVLGRLPNFIELSIFSVMWSENCSNKSSIIWLKTLPKDGKKIIVGKDEESTPLVDIGDGLACFFKLSSHNHPSAINPYQGASSGVGGVHRDVFSIGARPIASLNSFRFGNIEAEHTRNLIKGVVKGASDYGKTIEVPTLGGEVYFNNSYNQNIIVNVMSVGILKADGVVSPIAPNVGNSVFIVGALTGKDGIHGATFASADLTKASSDDSPIIQIGKPQQGKLLLEATQEAIKLGIVLGMKGMGAAGIISTASEMSANSGTGMRIDLDKIPTKEQEMKPSEILLSESQERALIVVEQGQENALLEVFKKRDLACAHVGEVTDTGRIEFLVDDQIIADVPSEMLVMGGGAPVYEQKNVRPPYFKKISKFNIRKIPTPKDIIKVAKKLFTSPNIVSKRWFNEQFDSNESVNNAPSDAAVVKLENTEKALAMTTDGNPFYVYADPYVGAMIAVAEASRNIICAGGIPVAASSCLNFGNPNNSGVYWQFLHAVKGIGEACRKFKTPITNSHVSFYNQSVFEDKIDPIYPTPIVGMIGVLEDSDEQVSLNFKDEGDIIYMLGNSYNDIGSSEYLRMWHGIHHSPAPHFDLHEEYEIQNRVLELIKKGIVESVHDVSEGGLFTTLIESAIVGDFGFKVETVETFRKDAFLFGESQSRIVLSIKPDREDDLQNFLISNNVSFTKLGEVFGNEAIIDEINFGSIDVWKALYEDTLGKKMEA